jgi:hypothetical protein
MARQTGFKLTVDSAQVEGLADRLGRVVGREFGLACQTAVNEVTLRFDREAQQGMTADIALTPAYVRSKTDVVLAERPVNPRSEIRVRGDLTILGRFPLQQLTQPARTRAKGDPARGIPAGQKQAGVKATIRRSAPAAREKWFTMRLRAGAGPGANVGVFVRQTGSDRPKHIYGPSPYSLFRFQVESRIGSVEDDLQRTALTRTAEIVERVVR